MRKKGRTITSGFLVMTGMGFLTLSGAGIAQAQPAAAPATCTGLLVAFKGYTTTIEANKTKFETDHSAYVAATDNYGNKVISTTSHGSPALRSAAKAYVTEIETDVADNDLNTAKLTADSDRLIVLACTPSGAPATGGGSSAVLQDPALFGIGGAAALAGLAVAGLALRRPRTGADNGQ